MELWSRHPASDLRHRRTLKTYRAMQKRFAGIKPNCAVRNPIKQMTMLLTAARSQPSQQRRPTKIVETIVRMQDKKSSRKNTETSPQISMPQQGLVGCNPQQKWGYERYRPKGLKPRIKSAYPGVDR